MTARVRRTVLAGGLRVITEQLAGVRSASVGVWVGVGSRDETPRLHGCSHFLEHLLFKGTEERSALDISVALDAVGGEFNAFTAKEYTCFHARVLDEDLPLAVDVLGDMVTSSRFTAEDVEAERDVILDEIAMHDDDPDDVVHNLFARAGVGRLPAGPPDRRHRRSRSPRSRRADRRGSTARHYRPANMVVAAAGNVDHAALVRWVDAAFGRNGLLTRDEAPVPPRAAATARGHAGHGPATRPFEQVNVVLGVDGLTRPDDRRFALGVLNTALGGGTSSRLFQEVREHRGLAYSVFSFASHHADSGLVGVSVGCLPSKLDDVLAVVRAELAKVAADGITAEELARGKGQLRGGLVLGLEDSGSRMSRLGKAELVYDELLTIDEVIARIDAVTLEEVRELAAELFSQPEVLAVVGPGRDGPSGGRAGSRRAGARAGAAGGPQHAAEGADDEPLGGAGARAGAQLGVAAEALEGQHDRQPLRPAGGQARRRPRPARGSRSRRRRAGPAPARRWTARGLVAVDEREDARGHGAAADDGQGAGQHHQQRARARRDVDVRRGRGDQPGGGQQHDGATGGPDPRPGGCPADQARPGRAAPSSTSTSVPEVWPLPRSRRAVSRAAASWVASSRARRPSTMPAACGALAHRGLGDPEPAAGLLVGQPLGRRGRRPPSPGRYAGPARAAHSHSVVSRARTRGRGVAGDAQVPGAVLRGGDGLAGVRGTPGRGRRAPGRAAAARRRRCRCRCSRRPRAAAPRRRRGRAAGASRTPWNSSPAVRSKGSSTGRPASAASAAGTGRRWCGCRAGPRSGRPRSRGPPRSLPDDDLTLGNSLM